MVLQTKETITATFSTVSGSEPSPALHRHVVHRLQIRTRPGSRRFSPVLASNSRGLLREGGIRVGVRVGVKEKMEEAVERERDPLGNAMLPIRFFKIILKTNLQRIKIPNKFAMRYGSGLPNPVFIKPPDGTEWKVYWTTQNGEVWLEKGWKQFVEHYSLDQGHLIFFEYQGTSHIDVLIHDQSSLEIEYPYCDEKDNIDDNNDDVILDEWPDQKSKHITEMRSLVRELHHNWPKQKRAQEVASNFISCNPFFTLFIKPVHVVQVQMAIPDLKGIIEKKEKYVTLQFGERSWNVKFSSSHNNSTSRSRLCAGWSLFARESELLPGDVCVFELISREDLVFKVHVFQSHT
ncbi:LOW QUALITY PROTEIN: putative B3 domain-containing protein Os03g0621600 [Cajanus cajan]|uniref:LOW QUALITY PROTEIN: putative B3 domain-containing protein Os03g0621600 n=1 Tax=Cajanus cajan TaxID=3821 RepID=UPI0010FB14AB|nr:LOW QUALITY PROTEIN: putative B3 domain-containing protein Os03g0621600 [Cajanus cajan]